MLRRAKSVSVAVAVNSDDDGRNLNGAQLGCCHFLNHLSECTKTSSLDFGRVVFACKLVDDDDDDIGLGVERKVNENKSVKVNANVSGERATLSQAADQIRRKDKIQRGFNRTFALVSARLRLKLIVNS